MTLLLFAASLGLLSSPPSPLHVAPAARSAAEPPLPASVVGRRTAARFLLLTASSGLALPARADENRWISGRSDPIRKTSKEKPDGTKKDPSFLRCLNDCVPRCLGPPAAGVQKERSDCLLECQDECCATYEQCTTTIKF